MFCSKCGSALAAGAVFCAVCGQATYSPPAFVPAAAMPVAYPGAVPFQVGGVQYAGFWLRFVAHLIDNVIMVLGFVVLIIPVAILTGAGSAFGKIHSMEDPEDLWALFGLTFIFAFIGIAFLGIWLYNAGLESSSWQGTVGKKVLNLKVTDMVGQPISFGRASGRFFSKIITNMIPLGIGYILAGFTERKQAIHDMIASCLVLRQG